MAVTPDGDHMINVILKMYRLFVIQHYQMPQYTVTCDPLTNTIIGLISSCDRESTFPHSKIYEIDDSAKVTRDSNAFIIVTSDKAKMFAVRELLEKQTEQHFGFDFGPPPAPEPTPDFDLGERIKREIILGPPPFGFGDRVKPERPKRGEVVTCDRCHHGNSLIDCYDCNPRWWQRVIPRDQQSSSQYAL
jgi:hypothetical protein